MSTFDCLTRPDSICSETVTDSLATGENVCMEDMRPEEMLPSYSGPSDAFQPFEVRSSDLESEIASCIGEESTDILKYLPPGINRSNITLCPGGLPLELWFRILDNIDNLKTWFACGLTCKLLESRIRQVAMELKRAHSETFASLDLHELHHAIVRHPIVSNLVDVVRISARSTTKFIYEFSGKLHALHDLYIAAQRWHYPRLSPNSLPPFRPLLVSAASRFRSLSFLSLSYAVFWNFRDFARLICAFPCLIRLHSKFVSWRRDEGCDLSDEPFAKLICLHEIQIDDGGDISKYKRLFSAPTLSLSVTHLSFKETELSSGIYCYIIISRVDGHARTATIDISFHTFGSPQWLPPVLDVLDDFLGSPAMSTLTTVDVELRCIGGYDEEIFGIFAAEPLPFPLLRARGPDKFKITKTFDIYKDGHMENRVEELMLPAPTCKTRTCLM
ncbi:hypothetical protein OBBRIDRAFT_796792 [Obba rivulosa]|uniref:F-box domain-containing protein n=1 Tax=Obba rivulosa TaxID=1052685 RepID=A0A8E2DH93_9APHY|nr:hypothetical protein OBBRIDRAFT_796792 [Obba rivulosa]